jgi:PleD family two-component response regulator
MQDGQKAFFDLPSLLRLGSIDMHLLIRSNLSMQVGEYFHLLLKFLDYAPVANDSLKRIALLKSDPEDFKNIEIISLYLEEIGNIKFQNIFQNIIDKGKSRMRTHEEIAAEFARKVCDDYSRFYTRLNATKKTEEEPKVNRDYEFMRLKDYLNVLEEEEAARKLRILVVDDTPVMLKTILSILDDTYKVYIMPDPMRVEKFLTQIMPDMFLLDYQMPELNGFELLLRIRKFEEHKHTPVIFLTSEGTTSHVAKAISLGACDFMVKPIQADQLIEKVAQHIVRRKLVQ